MCNRPTITSSIFSFFSELEVHNSALTKLLLTFFTLNFLRYEPHSLEITLIFLGFKFVVSPYLLIHIIDYLCALSPVFPHLSTIQFIFSQVAFINLLFLVQTSLAIPDKLLSIAIIPFVFWGNSSNTVILRDKVSFVTGLLLVLLSCFCDTSILLIVGIGYLVSGLACKLNATPADILKVDTETLLESLPVAVMRLKGETAVLTNQSFKNLFSVKSNESTVVTFIDSIKFIDDYQLEQAESTGDILKSLIKNLPSSHFSRIGVISKESAQTTLVVQAKLIDTDTIDFVCFDFTDILKEEREKAELKVKSLFLAKIAHELKNPLLTIGSVSNFVNDLYSRSLHNLEFLLESDLGDKLDFLAMVANHAVLVINDLQAYCQIPQENECQSPRRTKSIVNIKKLVKFAVCFGESKAKLEQMKNEIRFVAEIDENVPECVEIDCVKLKQILINLVSNAVKYTKKGEVIIKVSLISSGLATRIRWQISDTGIGMDENKLELIKSKSDVNIPFYKEEGSGIGLRIVKESLDNMGSELEIFSEKYKGSSFSFQLNYRPYSFGSVDRNMFDVFDDDRTERFDEAFDIQMSDREKSEDEDDLVLTKNFTMTPFQSIEKKITTKTYVLKNTLSETKLNEKFKYIRSYSAKQNSSTISVVKTKRIKLALPHEEEPNVIVTDDDEFTLKTHVRIVEQYFKQKKENVNVIPCINGIDCLYHLLQLNLEKKKIIALLIDESMPFMKGSAAIKIIRSLIEDGQFSRITIASVTAYFDEMTVKHLMSIGTDMVLNKPISKTNLDRLFSRRALM